MTSKYPTIKQAGLSRLSPLIIGIVTALIIILGASLIFSCIIFYSSLSETYLASAALIITAVGSFTGGLFAGKKAQTKGLFHGLFVGVIVLIILYLLGLITSGGQTVISIHSVYYLLAAAIGGVIGVR
ncbi:MAG: TIGR04086 family membrane protein [Bacillota bacterium]|jgi:putative membrane protein (TIGR04086 family)